MKTFSLDDVVTMCTSIFDCYVEPYAYAVMSGELPAITYMVHRTGSKDHDWSANIRLKNTMTISVFRCEVWIDDILSFCRTCRLYLITEDVFRPVSLFYMLHGLLQSQYMNFDNDIESDYESMMVSAGHNAYQFMKEHYQFHSEIERRVLDIVWYNSMILTNNYKYAPKQCLVGEILNELHGTYEHYMFENHAEAYRTAKRMKAQTSQVDEDGFFVLERITNGHT